MSDDNVEIANALGAAMNAELVIELQKLKASFDTWESGERKPVELCSDLEAFVRTRLQELHTIYRVADPVYALAYAVRRGVLRQEDIPEGVKSSVNDIIGAVKM